MQIQDKAKFKMTADDITVRVDPFLNLTEGKVTIITETKLYPSEIRRWNLDDLSADIYRIIKDKLYSEAHLGSILQNNIEKKIEELQTELDWFKKKR